MSPDNVSPSKRISGAPPTLVEEETLLRKRVQGWIAGRVFVALLLLGGTLLADARPESLQSFTGGALLGLAAATFLFALVSAVFLTRPHGIRALAITQIVGDIALTTALVYLVGGVASGFTFLYGITTLVSAIILGPRASRAATVWSVLLYVTLGTSLANGWLPQPPDQDPSRYLLPKGEVGFAMLRNLLGLALVSLLANNLSTRLRRTGGELRQASESAATLAQLNDDIVRSITAGLVTTDVDERIRTINPSGAAMFGVTPDKLIGVELRTLLPGLDMSSSESQDIARRETVARRPDGSTFPVGFTRTPLISFDARTLGGLVVFQDLSEVTLLRETAERAERLAALGRIAASLAHEIRNPLGSISGSVQIVRESTTGDEDKHLLGIVLHEVERLDDLVTTMLDVSRPRTPELREVDLTKLAREVVEVARGNPAYAQSRFVLKGDASLLVRVDGDQMRQVLWNLIKNALQNSPKHGEVEVGVYRDANGEHVIEVRDHGQGVAPDTHARLFDMFYSRREHGIGIGLALVKQIVDAHHGRIEVENHPEGGAVFRIRLPSA